MGISGGLWFSLLSVVAPAVPKASAGKALKTTRAMAADAQNLITTGLLSCLAPL
jgi:hypothetical protein